ncbi:MAG: 5'/3'-nucleotidase SurE [Candidatus Krumholzibacteria bacterium]|nr:5'/3'-nucleotidase SurE [Candidatus Krumholzibacteria bacterium]MDH4337181.1 5'/3'-nucleotidase SurE [Candidatus Krumholzibacteria bacterium]MDH5269101.1 5'/3'-nucleotidase SurE [Candidatus Krumholzibacteria bacterium]MDH5628277.1 5'/3'-nucleotidase SurE [Candidatus Krumholzibacteria bacterium]
MHKRILISNDDGFDARGIQVLERALQPLGDVFVVAPDSEQSASSHSLTIRRPIDVKRVDDHHYRVVGTPTDCVVLALQVILDRPPDLIVSGINHGPNMGEDVTYSGTVAVAFEGTILGVPSVAISALQRSVEDEDVNGRVARRVVERALEYGVPAGALLNVNIPNPEKSPVKGLRFTKLGSRHYENFIEPITAELKTQYTIGGRDPVWRADDGTDIAAVRMGFVSITPLHLDLTHYKAIVEMERWRFEL